MIAKISRGTSIIRLVRYLFSPGRHNEHTNQRVAAAADTLDVPHGVALGPAQVTALGRDCDAPHADFGTEVAKGHVWHLSLSNHVADRHLSDEEWAAIARRAMEAMGFTGHEGRAPCRWVAVGHGTSLTGNEHIHIAVALVREDGTVASIWRDRVTMSRVCAEMERLYGLTPTHRQAGVGLPGVTRAEQERAAREERPEPDRINLARQVRAASVASASEAEFVRRLRRSGVPVRPRYAPGGQERVVGYSVSLRPDGAAQPVWFGGGTLARDVALPRLRELWEATPTEMTVAVTEWRTNRPTTTRGRESAVGSPEGWALATEAVQEACQRLAGLPVDDVAQWSGTARELAGVFAAWSARLEGSAPGPLARAAHVLSRSAQTPRGRLRGRRGVAGKLRGVAVITAQARTDESSEKEWAALLWEMRRATLLVSRWQATRGERVQANRLVALAADDLAVLLEPMQRGPLVAVPGSNTGAEMVRTPPASSVVSDGQSPDRRVSARSVASDTSSER